MSKKLTFICLFMLSIIGLNAQTFCYHLYKHYDNMGNAESRDSYRFITFDSNWLYPSEYASPYISINNQVVCQSYKYSPKITNEDGDLYFGYYDPKDDGYLNSASSVAFYRFYYLVSKDKRYISYFRNLGNGNITEDCYERCDDMNCKQNDVTNTPTQRSRRR